MVVVPSAIIFVNKDLVDQVRQHLIKQLHITEAIDGYVFDQRLVDNPNYIDDVKALNQRILVERPFTELENRAEADIAIFIKNAIAAVLKNNFGPPRQSFQIINLHWGQLGIF